MATTLASESGVTARARARNLNSGNPLMKKGGQISMTNIIKVQFFKGGIPADKACSYYTPEAEMSICIKER